jgi:hypothetical protein
MKAYRVKTAGEPALNFFNRLINLMKLRAEILRLFFCKMDLKVKSPRGRQHDMTLSVKACIQRKPLREGAASYSAGMISTQ